MEVYTEAFQLVGFFGAGEVALDRVTGVPDDEYIEPEASGFVALVLLFWDEEREVEEAYIEDVASCYISVELVLPLSCCTFSIRNQYG